jgi:hypothetical protein
MKNLSALVTLFCAIGASASALAQDPAETSPPAAPMETAPPAATSTETAPPVVATSMSAAGNFGLLSQIVISGDLQFDISRSSTGDSDSTTVLIQPALDYFVAPNFSVGGMLAFGSGSSSFMGEEGADVTILGIGARGGFNLPLADAISLWPRLSLSYVNMSFSSGGSDASGYSIPLDIFAPVLWHPAAHFFIGVGPVFSTELVNKVEGESQDKTTSFGLQSTVGGYFGGI